MVSEIRTQWQAWRLVISTGGMTIILFAPHVVSGREPAGREDQPMITKRAFLPGHTGGEGRNYPEFLTHIIRSELKHREWA